MVGAPECVNGSWSNALQEVRRLALTFVVSAVLAGVIASGFVGSAFAAIAVGGGDVILEGGTYQLARDAAGVISIETTQPVVIVGNGASWNEGYEMTSSPQEDLHFDCSAQGGVNLTLKNVHISNSTSVKGADGNMFGVLGFAGKGNVLILEGVSVIDYQVGGGNSPAAIRVAQGDELRVEGSGALYLYKSAQGSGIGGSSKELNGDITFAVTKLFAKGSKQGALIGAGSDSAQASGLPGVVAFERGTYNLVANSRGGCIGGGAGGDGASGGTTVHIGRAACINVNVDYSGAAIGGGGYKSGNDASGGTVVFHGGSLRIYTDKNAVSDEPFCGYRGIAYAAGTENDAPMTAERYNERGELVYRCKVDVSALSQDFLTVRVDGEIAYMGGRHEYSYAQEALDKDQQIETVSTPSNWRPGDERCIYLYLTGESHEISVAGAVFDAAWNAEDQSFELSQREAKDCEGLPGTCPYSGFRDFSQNAWYHPYLDWAVENGILSGFASGKLAGCIGPTQNATRAQMVTVLYRMEGSPEVSVAASFGDVGAGSWYADAVSWAVASGITTGYTSGSNKGNFGPDDLVTREQLATFLHRYAQHKGFDISAGEYLGAISHPDASKISAFAVEPLSWAIAEGIISGYSDSGKIGPQDSAQRAQLAAMLQRMDAAYGIVG